ncbi:MAG: biotin--[acetyl-CoA-carboxylase] ligase [Holosporales bacterium]|jgi:BirA family biotin operon repressor/biotin-[acetyl-CoA-carboxylase] ligase|nr:biotin--[acetyl-CoA-carboxylase] ligase [Holosporales bacterium]
MNLKIKHFTEIDSTNDYAVDSIISSNIDSDYAIIADKQLAGRGRLNKRIWESPPGNFYCTYVFNLGIVGFECEKTNSLIFIVMKAIRAFLVELVKSELIDLKLPNDILVKGKKLAGVLIEVLYPYAAVGIGINLISSPIKNATNLKDEFDLTLKPSELVENLYVSLLAEIKQKCNPC